VTREEGGREQKIAQKGCDVITTYSYVYVHIRFVFCVLNKDQSINFRVRLDLISGIVYTYVCTTVGIQSLSS